MSELIKHAAVKSKEGWIFFGKCHADCFHKAHHINVKMSQKAEDQGFLTNLGRYVQRGEGYQIAIDAGQIIERKSELDPDLFDTGTGTRSKILFSEDLWSAAYYGMHRYCEINGYIKTKEIVCGTM